MDLAGREEQLARVLAALAPSVEGARAAVIEGEPGIGKSSLWTAALDQLAPGRRVLTTRLVEPDAQLAYVGLHDLFDPIADEVLPSLAPPLADALEVALRRRLPEGDGVESGSIAIAIHAALRVLAARGPVLLAIDDAQWLDAASAAVLASALRRVTDGDVAVLAARRTTRREAAMGLDVPAAVERTERVPVPPLPLGALHHAVRTHLGVSLSRPTLVRLHEVTRGNPFYALELVRSWPRRGEGLLAADLPMPDELGALLGRRFDGISEGARAFAAAAAIDARPTVRLVAAALELDSPEARRLAAELRSAGVLDETGGVLEFAHPLLAHGATRFLDEVERRRFHARLADAVDDEVRRAAHLAASIDTPDATIAAALEAAATSELARGATRQAAALLDRSVELTPADDDDDRARREAGAAEALFIAGDVRRARELLEHVLAGDPPDAVRLDAALTLATLTWFEGDSRVATGIAEAALATTDDPGWRGKYHSRLSWMYEHDIAQATAHARMAMSVVDRTVHPARYAFALMNAAYGELQLGLSAHEDWIEEGYVLQQQARVLEISTLPANWAKAFDRFDRARELAAEFQAQAELVGDDSSVAAWPIFLGELEGWAGNLALALQLEDEGMSLAEQTQQPAYVCAALARRGWIRAARGDTNGGREDGNRALALAEELASSPLIGLSLGALGFVALTEDDPAAAIPLFDRADAVMVESADVYQPGLRYQADHIEALVRVGRLDEAAVRLRMHEARGELGPRPWAQGTASRCRALLAAATGDSAAALEACEAALAIQRDLPNPLELARTLLVKGTLERRMRQRKAAAASLSEAVAILERIGAARWAERARAELERVGLQRTVESELTPSEERIARMAASGMTNKEVSARLLISPKTVEANLARVYAKLGIRSRAELGSVMGRDADA